ncbi:hypothetical protein ACWIUD_07750 [Helicobacter sp. 23-1044]
MPRKCYAFSRNDGICGLPRFCKKSQNLAKAEIFRSFHLRENDENMDCFVVFASLRAPRNDRFFALDSAIFVRVVESRTPFQTIEVLIVSLRSQILRIAVLLS